MKLIILVCGWLLVGCNQVKSTKSVIEKEQIVSIDEGEDRNEDTILGSQESLMDSTSIQRTIALFQELNIDQIAKIVSLPLRREFPIPDIKTESEFKERFGEVFDEFLIAKIADSRIDDWTTVGWRGSMLDDGLVWMANSDGIITVVNYQSDVEKDLLKRLIAKERDNLHASLKSYLRPTYKVKTKSYILRIDEIADGDYRLALWKSNQKESSKPDLILNHGVLEFQGTGGNHVISFLGKDLSYFVYRNIIGESDTAAFSLEVEKDGQVIIAEEGSLIFE